MLQTTECFLCGYGIYKGNRFCSDRCREAFDAGHSRLDPNQARALLVLPLDGWRVVAGPTISPIGTSYYTAFSRRRGGRRTATESEKWAPVHELNFRQKSPS
jgi:predicted nucleic acid-binding Zn ribbon protein